MNWDATSAIAELLGAVGVIAWLRQKLLFSIANWTSTAEKTSSPGSRPFGAPSDTRRKGVLANPWVEYYSGVQRLRRIRDIQRTAVLELTLNPLVGESNRMNGGLIT